jgi:hypothetical protein
MFRKSVCILVVIAISFLLVAAVSVPLEKEKPPQPPKKINLDIINKSGETIYVQLVGTGYNFADGTFGNQWNVPYGFYSVTIPGGYIVVFPDGSTNLIKQDMVRNLKVIKDMYAVKVGYEQEKEGFVCLNNWLPQEIENDIVYFPASKKNVKLTVRPCDSIPLGVGNPSGGVIKYNKAGLWNWDYWNY